MSSILDLGQPRFGESDINIEQRHTVGMGEQEIRNEGR